MKQRYNFKTKWVWICTCLLMLSFSCTDNFEYYNTHRTNPSPEDMTVVEQVGTLFPGMLYLMHNAHENDNQMIEQMVGNQYGGYMVTNNNWQGTNFGTFNPSAGWVEYPFNKLFSGFYANYFKIADVTGKKGYIYAWATIVRVAVMLRVTDTYGPIPYSMMGDGNMQVSYDEEQAVYHNMIDGLTESVATLTAFVGGSTGTNSILAEYDAVYRGDFTRWIKFANSLKLRMAVRIAHVDEAYAKQAMQEALAGIGPIESNSDNAFLPTTDNPYRKSAIEWNNGNGDVRINATLTAYMNGYKDPRQTKYMTNGTTASTFTGVRMGIDKIDGSKYKACSYPNFTADSPLLVFCAAETKFLKAEAALRGWIAGDARTFYEEGIRTSMEQHGVDLGNYLTQTGNPAAYTDPANPANNYPADRFTSITVPWTNGNASTQLEKIITQKWLANYPLGFEAWSDFRRTGFPQMMPAVNNLSSGNSMGEIENVKGRMVRRLPYPVSEYNGNNEHVTFAVQHMISGGQDVGSADLWWAKKK
jgi:hypothetical protein